MAQIIFAIVVGSLLLNKSFSQDLNKIVENEDHFYNDLLKKYGKSKIITSISKIYIFFI